MKVKANDRQVEEHEILRHWNLTERYPIRLTGKPTWLWTFADDHGTYLEKAGNILVITWEPPKITVLTIQIDQSLMIFIFRLKRIYFILRASEWNKQEKKVICQKSLRWKTGQNTEDGSLQKTILSNSGLSYKRQKEVLLLCTLKKVLVHLKQIVKQWKVLVAKLKSLKSTKMKTIWKFYLTKDPCWSSRHIEHTGIFLKY